MVTASVDGTPPQEHIRIQAAETRHGTVLAALEAALPRRGRHPGEAGSGHGRCPGARADRQGPRRRGPVSRVPGAPHPGVRRRQGVSRRSPAARQDPLSRGRRSVQSGDRRGPRVLAGRAVPRRHRQGDRDLRRQRRAPGHGAPPASRADRRRGHGHRRGAGVLPRGPGAGRAGRGAGAGAVPRLGLADLPARGALPDAGPAGSGGSAAREAARRRVAARLEPDDRGARALRAARRSPGAGSGARPGRRGPLPTTCQAPAARGAGAPAHRPAGRGQGGAVAGGAQAARLRRRRRADHLADGAVLGVAGPLARGACPGLRQDHRGRRRQAQGSAG